MRTYDRTWSRGRPVLAAFSTRKRTTRSLVAAVAALSAAFTVVAAPSAPADELGDKQRRVHREIDQAQEELRDST
ncbi:MAG TPA: hypothetical protein VF165_01720, partial [Nocardioidaceae bacterium]